MNAFWLLPVLAYGQLFLKNGTCWTYLISPENMTYDKAEAWCQSNNTHLFAIQNKNESEQLNLELPPNAGHYWIGIKKLDNEWRWVHTKVIVPKENQNWAEGEPNNKQEEEICVEIYVKRAQDEGKWNDEICGKKKAALCYKASCEPYSCNGHGECIETINNYICHCDRGFHGRDCENVVECGVLKIPKHGLLNCSQTSGSFACEFACEEGFILKGLSRLQCGASGEWDGQEPECEDSGNTASVIPIGVAATGASLLTVLPLIIWLLKHLRRTENKFLPASSPSYFRRNFPEFYRPNVTPSGFNAALTESCST